jgi:hypothetical protein
MHMHAIGSSEGVTLLEFKAGIRRSSSPRRAKEKESRTLKLC